MGLVHILSVFQNAHGVHEPVGTLLRHHIGQIRVVLPHGQVVAGVIGGDSGVAPLHGLEDLVHIECLIDALGVGISQQLIGLTDLTLISGIDGVAQIVQRNAQGVTGVADHHHIVGVLLIEHRAPTGNGLVYHSGVIDDAQSTPGVRYGIQILWIIGQIPESWVDLLKVGDLAVVQLLKHPLLNQLRDHIVRGDDNIIVRSAQGQGRIQRLVALGGLVVDLDAGLLLKFIDQACVDILTPAAHIDDPLSGVGATAVVARAAGTAAPRGIPSIVLHGASGQEQAQRHGHGEGQGCDFFQFIIPPVIFKNISPGRQALRTK